MLNGANGYKNLQVLEASSASELVDKLKAIRVPIRVVGFDNDGVKFYAYINSERRFNLKGE